MKLEENKKYKVKFKRKKINHIIYFYLITFTLLFLAFVVDKVLPISFPKKPVYSLLIITIVTVSFHLVYTSKYSFSQVQRTKALLRDVIQYNRLFVDDKESNPYQLITSIRFIFYKSNNSLYIEAYSNGAPYALQTIDLGKKLESALNLNLTDISDITASHITFIFDLNISKRLIVNKTMIVNKETSVIPLDTNKVWDYSATPHALISGATGSGKTYMVYYLVLEFAKIGADILLLDPKRSDLSSLKSSIPNGANKIASTPTSIAKILRETNEEMNKRYERMFSHETTKLGTNYKEFDLNPIVIVFDEVAAAMEEDKKIGKEIDSYLKQLILKGRQSGVFVILSTQKPSAEAISTVIRDQVGLRIALGQLSKNGYRMTLGDDWDELPSGRTGIGRGFIYIDGNGWTLPRPFVSPLLDFKTFNYRDELYSAMVKN